MRQPISLPNGDDAARRYAVGALQRAIERVAAAGDGTRNDTLNAETFALSRFVREDALCAAELANALAVAAAHAGLPARDHRHPGKRALRRRCRMNAPFDAARIAADAVARASVAAAERAHQPDPPAVAILERSACPAPELPLDVFGPFWSAWIAQAAEGANAPPDYVAMPLLAVSSSLLGNARWAAGWKGWAEPPALWCASVGNPSSSKSSGASPVSRDVLAVVERHVAKDYPRDVEQRETLASVARAVLKQWEKDTATAIEKKLPVPEKPPRSDDPAQDAAPSRPRGGRDR